MKTVLADEERLIKPGRALLAVTGLRRVLQPGGLKITKDDFAKSAKLEPRIRDLIDEFLDGKQEPVPMPAYDHDDVTDLLFKTMGEESLTAKLARFGGSPAGDDYIAAASQAVLFLRNHVPRRFRSTFVGPQPVHPSKSELMTWRWLLETVGDPLWALRQLLAATLGSASVDALASVWPDVLQAARMSVDLAIADRLAKDPQLSFSRRQIRQLGVLTGNDPTAPPELVKALQDAFSAEVKDQQQEQARAREAAKPDDRLSTSVQRTAADR